MRFQRTVRLKLTRFAQQLKCAATLEHMIASECSAQVFASGANPGALAAEVSELAGILGLIAAADSPGDAEDIICSHLNKTIPNRITRATVNMPSALIPYAVAFSSLYRTDGQILYRAAAEGGSVRLVHRDRRIARSVMHRRCRGTGRADPGAGESQKDNFDRGQPRGGDRGPGPRGRVHQGRVVPYPESATRSFARGRST